MDQINTPDHDPSIHKDSFYRKFNKKIDKSRKIYKKEEIFEIISLIKNAKANPAEKNPEPITCSYLTKFLRLPVSNVL